MNWNRITLAAISVAMIAIAPSSVAAEAPRPHEPITQEELVRRAQEMMDAVAAGDQTP